MSKMSGISKLFLVISILFISIIVFFYNPYNFDFKHYELVDWPRMVEILKEKHLEIVDMKYITTRTSKYDMKTKVDVIVNNNYTNELEDDIQRELYRLSMLRRSLIGYSNYDDHTEEALVIIEKYYNFKQNCIADYNYVLTEDEINERRIIGFPMTLQFIVRIRDERKKVITSFRGQVYENESYWEITDPETNELISKEITFEDFFD